MNRTRFKIVFFGTDIFAVPSLITLAKLHDVIAVVTQPDAPQGRKMTLTPSPVKVKALELNLPVLQPEKIRKNADFLELLKNLNPDYLIVIAYGKVIPDEILAIPKYCPINLHGSLLPKYRGASPIQQAIFNGDTETGITFMEMDSGIDTGKIFLTRRMLIEEEDKLPEVKEKLALLGAIIFPDLLEDISMEVLTGIKQNEDKASHCQKIQKEDGRINWSKETADQIINKLRAFTPWPGCFSTIESKRVKLLDMQKCELNHNLKPGETLIIGKTKMVVGTYSGDLVIKSLQIEGKKEVSIEEFLKGNSTKIKFE